MGLKLTVAKLDDVPEAARSFYKQDGDKFVLDADGVVAKERLDEFRNNNITMQQQLDKLKDIDPDKYKELMKIKQKVDEKELIDKGEFEKVVNIRVTAMREELENKANTATDQLTKAQQLVTTLMVDNVIKSEAIKIGVLPGAVDDVVLRAKTSFVVEEGKPVLKDTEGKIVYGKDGTTPMTVNEWMLALKKSAPHLFFGVQGSGAGGGNNVPTGDTSKMTPIQKIATGLALSNSMQNIPGAT